MNIKNSKRIVVKVGSSMIFDTEKNCVRREWLKSLAEDVVNLISAGKEVIIVASGAVALGREFIKNKTHLSLAEKQAASSCGQVFLMDAWQESFTNFGYHIGQLLLTKDTADNLRRCLNARDTLETLLKYKLIPLINENDSVTTEEIRIGDNDQLAALVAQMFSADTLILLSDIDGMYTEDPHKNPDARFIPEITEITEEIEAMAGDTRSAVGTGGMITKLEAAKIAYRSGCNTVILKGKVNHPLHALENKDAKCTWFVSDKNPRMAREHWIADILHSKGEITLYDSEIETLQNGQDLVPVGVMKISGEFERGDLVLIRNKNGDTIGKGLSAYKSCEAEKIIGKYTHDVDEILGYEGRKALIFREDIVLA